MFTLRCFSGILLISRDKMPSQLLGRLLKIQKRFSDLENHPTNPLKNYSLDSSNVSVKYLKTIFIICYEIGIFGEIAILKNPPENIRSKVLQSRANIIELITTNADWLANYIPVYARKEIDFIDLSSKEVVYKIRSGIEFLLEDFQGISSEFDGVLFEIKEYSSVRDEFDEILNRWIESGLHYPLKEADIPKSLPSSHWWWRKALFN